MKCKSCGGPMVQLFVSWACDHCDGKLMVNAPVDPLRVWVAVLDQSGRELLGGGYKRVAVQLTKTTHGDFSKWCGTVTLPQATNTWHVHRMILVPTEHGEPKGTEVTMSCGPLTLSTGMRLVLEVALDRL